MFHQNVCQIGLVARSRMVEEQCKRLPQTDIELNKKIREKINILFKLLITVPLKKKIILKRFLKVPTDLENH